MLMPKRVKHRKVMRGRMSGLAKGGHTVAFGEYGLATSEPAWITSRQIEAARRAMTRSVKPGRILFEMAGIGHDEAVEAMRLASHKLPVTTRVVVRESVKEAS